MSLLVVQDEYRSLKIATYDTQKTQSITTERIVKLNVRGVATIVWNSNRNIIKNRKYLFLWDASLQVATSDSFTAYLKRKDGFLSWDTYKRR